ncbi:123d7658-45d7-40e1-a742-98d2f110cb53 [Thermothielavioides terrestris]|uniref:123d7658-45d7-40e1-a742-98d2f110cb53 n=1 Tax=Thermothielavioides terrestris TaxID=2587410 RepID=A0A446BPA1_9PEZI|nr:123d7658-45d7-40e1-a742-98d2f110cb53 [Thermothielavioides terrestris]
MRTTQLVTVVSLLATGVTAAWTFNCQNDTWGACCQAYDPLEQVCIHGKFATNTTKAGAATATYECDGSNYIFGECCKYPQKPQIPRG